MRDNSKIKAIISDLDGVIRLFPNERDLAIEAKYTLPQGTIMKMAFLCGDLNEVVKGEITDKKWRGNIVERLSKAFPNIDAKLVIEEWTDFSGEINKAVLGAFKELKKGRPFYLMTNGTDKIKADLIKLKIQNDFDLIINSSELGFAKPGEEIFKYALGKLNLLSKEVVFIDDSKEHILKAEDMGFVCHHYQNIEDFQKFCREIL